MDPVTLNQDALKYKQYEKLGPFEIKDFLAKVASKAAVEASTTYLNAGRGNPNWLCTTPREAFGTLLRFAIEETRRDLNIPDAGRMPEKAGSGERFAAFLDANRINVIDVPGVIRLNRRCNLVQACKSFIVEGSALTA